MNEDTRTSVLNAIRDAILNEKEIVAAAEYAFQVAHDTERHAVKDVDRNIATNVDGDRFAIDRLGTQRWMEGQPHGVELVCQWLAQKSAEAFLAKRDDEARLLRGLVDEARREVGGKLTADANRHDVEFPWKLPKE